MYTAFKHLHSFTAYVALTFIVLAVLWAFFGWLRQRPFTKASKTIALLGLISAHLQMIFGLVLYFISPLGFSAISAEAMENSALRLYFLEHPSMMIIAIGLITVGYSKAKRMTDSQKKFNRIAIFYSLGLLLILLRIPWNVWLPL
jgi:hypothetical protein